MILYGLLTLSPVAKATIISTDPNTLVGQVPLGRNYCEVVIDVVIKRDATLPRPYDGMETMADAHMMCIAWPYVKVIFYHKYYFIFCHYLHSSSCC